MSTAPQALDTNSTVVIEKSPAQTFLVAALCLIFILTSIWMIFADLSGFRAGSGLTPVLGGIGRVFRLLFHRSYAPRSVWSQSDRNDQPRWSDRSARQRGHDPLERRARHHHLDR